MARGVKLGTTEIERARARLIGLVAETDVQDISPNLTLKLENNQHSGSFKARGAMNALLCSAVGRDGVLAASGGNHGAAVAWASQRLGYESNIFVPSIISSTKLKRLESYGANVHIAGSEYQETFEAAEEYGREHQCVEIHAYDQHEVIAGAGTLALEVDRQLSEFSTVVVACGGGGLSGGLATWWGAKKRIVVVETKGTATFANSLAMGKLTDVEVSGVAADSLGARRLGHLGWNALRSVNAESSVVSDADVLEAQSALLHEFDVVAEPAAAAGYAAIRSGRLKITDDERCLLIVCGGNSE